MQKTANGPLQDVPIISVSASLRIGSPARYADRYYGSATSFRGAPQILRVMRMITFFLFVGFLTAHASGVSQTVTFSGENVSLKQVFQAVKKQTGYVTLSRDEDLITDKPLVIRAKGMSLNDFLNKVLENLPLEFTIKGKTIFLSRNSLITAPKRQSGINETGADYDSIRTISGIVTSATDEPISGASILVRGSKKGVTTDVDGKFTIQALLGQTLVVSFVGYEDYTIKVSSNAKINIKMVVTAASMKDQVVTGIYQRKKESFSGSSATYTIRELKTIGNQNILQSLKTLDPSFAIIENNTFGSDPNRLPDIEIRGKSSVIGLTQDYGTNPNQPLFILDGFETTLSIISDFSMDRIESITILKDAAATAIYGSRAANGIVVVETKRPVAGQLRLSYNLNSTFNFADLSDYNLMNASEKLQFEKLSSFYGTLDANGNILSDDGETRYLNRLKEVERGVDTYWPNEPLRLALSQRHTLFAEGGDANLKYSASLSYGANNGVMKNSDRDITNGNIRLLYRKGRLSFNNTLSIDYVSANRETVPFSSFSRANPYQRKYNAQGEVLKVAESLTYLDIATFSLQSLNIYNPLYDFENKNVDKSASQGFTNNFEMEWRLVNELRGRARVGIRRITNKSQVFRSPFNTEFIGVDVFKQGSYSETNDHQMNYDGDLSLTYGKLFRQKHLVNSVVGVRLNDVSSELSGYEVQGFVDDEFTNPTFALGYPQGKSSTFQQAKRRAASFFLNTGYVYDNRFLMDATIRSDGSSVYGSNKQFTNIWSLGVGWNLHNESFARNLSWLNLLKLRGSIGNPGNQNFSDYISMRIYRYNNEDRNPFGSSVVLSSFGNKGLKWQKTLDRNLGVDLEVFNNRLRVNADYFNKNTDPLLVFVAVPSSSGTTSLAQNLGKQITKGFTVIADYTIIRKKDLSWRVNMNMRQLRSSYRNIGRSLDKYNEQNKSRNLVRYYDGASPSDLWAVRSLGIDPATGREVFLNSNNEQTFVHNYNDERVVGNSDPKVEGIVGSSVYYKGFSASVNLRCRLGGQVFMQTLYDKVENLSITNIAYNQDKRALYDRWKNPGDNAKFKSIASTVTTPISSRFVEDNNVLSGESISVGYETTTSKWLRSIGASSLTIRAYMNDIFRVSSITNERGIDYPFARSVSLSAGIRF